MAKSVLVVEDDPDIAGPVRPALEREHHGVRAVAFPAGATVAETPTP